MDYRQLGTTGCIVSTYGLGTMTFGAETSAETAFEQLDLFVERGGTLIDCADVYGGGEAERIVGEWLRSRPGDVADSVVLVTKGRFPVRQVGGSEGTSRRHLRRALDASLARLGRDSVEVYMPHAWDPLTPLEETLEFLDDAVRQGKVLYPGLSNYLGWQVQKAMGLTETNRLARPVVVQESYSLLVREVELEIVPASIDAGLGLLAWSPLGGGWLTGKYVRDLHPTGATRLGEDESRGIEAYAGRSARAQTWDVLGAVERVARALGVRMGQVALAWVAQQPAVTSVLVGARTMEQLKANLDAATLTLGHEHVSELNAVSAPVVGDWPYGSAGVDQRTRVVPSGR
ncbi:MAG: aldo/keto reductase [Cellulomonas sp. 73-92]|uniref:aldo/keto reductase n=1 Tax=Cellulomonas sp. 73-92 TaxID=1895740 RepID=UPI00092BA4EC|nr:aldo/keto reductase [Cellulomonas sp. 73-92]OJV83363.1 MAG: aldo/keto reductase [Cellulomonas sp. 73-92]